MGTSSSTSHAPEDSSPPTSPTPLGVHTPPVPSLRVTMRGIHSHDAPRESDFISAQALSRYRSSASRTFATERGWHLEDFGPIPILIDDVPVADWFDW